MKSLRKHVVGILLVAATGTILAQPVPDLLPSGNKEKDAEAKATLNLQMTVAEMAVQIVTFSKQVREDTKVVLVLQRKARKEKDVLKLNCVNDKLLQIKALRNIIERGTTAFESASLTDSQGRREFNDIGGNVIIIRQLREQAQLCAGEGELLSASDNGYTGPDLPDDPSDDLFPDDDYVEPAGYASPFN